MKPEYVLSAIAVLASTATAVVSVVVAFRSQRAAAREQHLWDERTETYLGLQAWLDALHAWRTRAAHEPAPDLPPDVNARTSIFLTSEVLRALAYLRTQLSQVAQAFESSDWNAFDRERLKVAEVATGLTKLMRDELRGYADPYAYPRRDRWTVRWWTRRRPEAASVTGSAPRGDAIQQPRPAA